MSLLELKDLTEHEDWVPWSDSPILIRRSKDPYGWMGNMSPYPVVYDAFKYRTTEALFQCMRFGIMDPICDEIRACRSPMMAKLLAKKHKEKRVITPQSPKDVENMKICLQLKLAEYPQLSLELLATRSQLIVEDCSKRPYGSGLFWGMSVFEYHGFIGKNQLGVLWMDIRKELHDDVMEYKRKKGKRARSRRKKR